MPFDFSPVQLILVLAIVLVVFGAKRLPEMARNLGSSAREFRTAVTGGHDDAAGATTAAAAAQEPAPAAAGPRIELEPVSASVDDAAEIRESRAEIRPSA